MQTETLLLRFVLMAGVVVKVIEDGVFAAAARTISRRFLSIERSFPRVEAQLTKGSA